MLRRIITGTTTTWLLAVILFSGCSGEDLGSFQQHDPQSIKLFDILNESPALSSLFQGLDPYEFNAKTDELVSANPELIVKTLRTMADTFYGDKVILPQAMSDMADSLVSFHNTYRENPDSLNTAYDVITDILNIEAGAMTGGADTLVNLLTILKNENSAYGSWNLFGENQEFSEIGTNGIDDLIGSLDFVKDLYANQEDFEDPARFMENLFQTIKNDGVNVEERVQEVIDFIKNPETPFDTVEATEMEVADWLAADPEKRKITDYLLNHLYPMVKEPILENAAVPDLSGLNLPEYITSAEDYRNFIKRGRWLLDDQMEFLKVSAATISSDYYDANVDGSFISNDTTNLVKWLMDGLYHDMDYYDHLEDVDVFDFENNELLAWLKKDIEPALNSALSLSGSGMGTGISPQRLKEILWDGWTYSPTSGGSTGFKGLFTVGSSDGNTKHENDGYVTLMAKTESSDTIPKPFRLWVHDVLNGDGDGKYFDGSGNFDDNPSIGTESNSVFKDINITYSNDNSGELSGYGDGASESQVETMITNLHLHLISEYYSPAYKKWAMTPEDGQTYFGDPDKNVQTLLAGMQTSMRNMLMLDRNGKAPGEAGFINIPIISEFVYVLATGYGISDPVNAPAEISLHNCLVSMNSSLKDRDYIAVDAGIFGDFNVYAIGDESIYRKSNHEGSGVKFATQRNMTAIELLQPGTFRRRENVSGQEYHEWHGKFSPTQGDVRGITNSDEKITISNFVLAEIALICWEGYGPYTYKGKAPNGSNCKYLNDWHTDSYKIDGRWFTDRGPGMKSNYSQYHVYEAVYRPANGSTGFEDSGYTDSNDNPMPKNGYIRFNSENGSYNNNSQVVTYGEANPDTHKVRLDCNSREEAIRKNFGWLINQKKYMFLIPMHPVQPIDIWGGLAHVDMEMFVYITINANGMAGLAKVKRSGDSVSKNAFWKNTNIDSNVKVDIKGNGDNYVLSHTSSGESTNVSRFTGVSFSDQDYCVAMDYTYDFKAKALGFLPIPNSITQSMMNDAINIPGTIWGCLGAESILPAAIGDNMASLSSLANTVYSIEDILGAGNSGNAAREDMSVYSKFQAYFDNYYPGANLNTLKDSELPPVPKVEGVSFPTAFNDSGQATSWEIHTGDSKGKFEDILSIIVAMVGSFHEDGPVYPNIGDTEGSASATYKQIYNNEDNGIAYFAKGGFRENLDTIALAISSLNDLKRGSGTLPSETSYNSSWLASLIDMNPDPNGDGDISDQQLEPGSRRGVLPQLLQSKYMNLNYMDPVKNAVEGTIRNIIRTYLNNDGNFKLSNGGTGDLEEMYLKDGDGDYELDSEGYKKINPAVDWNKSINRLRYFTDDRSLDRLKRTLDFVVDLSSDERFINFLRETIPALNTYLAVKHIDQRYRDDGIRITVQEAVDEGIFQISLEEDEPYVDENDNGKYEAGEPYTDVNFNGTRDEGTITRVVSFLEEFEYTKLIDFIKETGVNDIEKLYNFSFDHWGDVMDTAKLKEQVDDLNQKLVKYFGFNLKEGIIEGIYTIKDDIDIDNDGTIDFNNGDRIYGFGKYIESNDSDYDVEDDGKYFKYLNIKDYIFTTDQNYNSRTVNSAIVSEVEWPGIKEIFTVRNDEDYTDPWYRGSLEKCPYVYSPHKYDIRLDLAMNSWNELLLSLTSADFAYGSQSAAEMKLTYGKTNQKVYHVPDSLIDMIFGWNGSTFGGFDIKNRMNLAKDAVLDYIYDEKAIEVDDSYERILGLEAGDYIDSAKKTASVRTLVGKTRDFFNDNLFEYAYVDPDPDQKNETGELREVYMTEESIESGAGADPNFPHKHMINNVIDVANALLHPESPHYKTGELFDAWQTFIDSANITPERLRLARTAIAAIVYSESEKESFTDTNGNGRWDEGEVYVDANENNIYDDGYTRLFTKLSTHMPELLEAFKGSYDDLVELALIAFGPGGLGEYMLRDMTLGVEYEAWDITNELNTLMNQDIFRYFTYQDTFWWQMGTLMDDFATLIEAQPHYPGERINYYNETRSIFK